MDIMEPRSRMAPTERAVSSLAEMENLTETLYKCRVRVIYKHFIYQVSGSHIKHHLCNSVCLNKSQELNKVNVSVVWRCTCVCVCELTHIWCWTWNTLIMCSVKSAVLFLHDMMFKNDLFVLLNANWWFSNVTFYIKYFTFLNAFILIF